MIFLDQSRLFKGTVRREDRSLMNVPFVTGDGEWMRNSSLRRRRPGLRA